MEKILQLETIEQHNDYIGIETRHPLVNVVDGSKIQHPIPHARKRVGMYVIFLKELKCTDNLTYGRKSYDFQENTMVFIAPGQMFGHQADGSTYKASGWCLMFHPDLLRGTPLGKHMKDYTFFSYDANEALYLSPNYFGDLIKKETGRTAQEYVQQKAMDVAKDMLTQTDCSISEVAYCLGYQYPQYFSRAFKKMVGCTPNEYRRTN